MKQLKNFSSKKEPAASDDEVVKDYISKYDGFSEEQLVDELMRAVKNSKKNGSYSPQQMQTFVSMVAPQLSAAQKSKLENMMALMETEID